MTDLPAIAKDVERAMAEIHRVALVAQKHGVDASRSKRKALVKASGELVAAMHEYTERLMGGAEFDEEQAKDLIQSAERIQGQIFEMLKFPQGERPLQ